MKKDYIIFSSIDWGVHWQLHHQLTRSITKDGNRVLFIENTGVRRVRFNDFKRIIDKIKIRLKSVSGVQNISNKFSILVPIIFPFPYSKIFLYLNSFFLNRKISKWVDKSSFSNPVIITFLPTPLIHTYLNHSKFSLLIYYCANHMSEGSIESLPLKKWEHKMFKRSDLVFSISEKITERAMKFNSNVFYFPPGVDTYKVNKINDSPLGDIKHLKKPIIGYVGAIGSVFDLNLIEFIAKELPHFHIVLIGPVYININKVKKFKNIYFLGTKIHKDIFSYIKYFSVGIIPYIKNDFTDNVYCCKLNEYLLSGKPVISSNIHEVEIFNKKHDNIIYIAQNKIDFVKKIHTAINEFSQEKEKLFYLTGLSNDWEKRYTNIKKLITKNIDMKLAEEKFLGNDFIEYYKKTRKKIFYTFSLFLILFLLIFKSPLFFYLGEKLVVRQPLENSNSIVVFSGDGESNYTNQSYQKRAIDAVNYINKGISKNLILSSGKDQPIHEVILIKSYLLANGINEKYIHIFTNYPSSTYENVIMVGNYLIANKIDKVGFITSPYHSLRALLIWKKNFPNIKINVLEVIDTPSPKIKWSLEYSKIKMICYEYLSIIYNFLKGRL